VRCPRVRLHVSGFTRLLFLACASVPAIVAAIVPKVARADGPTSSVISVVGARTLPSGSTVVAGELGWPGAFASLHASAGSSLSLSLRGGLVYGSPFLSFATGLGGQLEAGGRLHLYGHDNIDVALSLSLGGAVGEGALFGERGFFNDDLGYGAYAEPGLLASFAVDRSLTLTGGIVTSIAYVSVPDRNIEPSHMLASAGVKLAVEALLSRDLLMFVQLTAGAGLRETDQFDNGTLLRLSLGAAYLM